MLQELDVLIGFVVVISVASLLIMVATQAISSCLALRGRNLRDALVALFYKISSDRNKATELAEKILLDPMYSDSALSMNNPWAGWLKFSSAIRPDECLQLIKAIANSSTTQPLRDYANELLTQLAASPELKAAEATKTAIQAAQPAPGELALVLQYQRAILEATQASIQIELQNWEKQFNSAQDRAAQWFTMNSRWWTVGLSFVAAFLLQLDTFELFKRISSDDALRNGLVNLSTAVEKRADEAMDEFSPGTVYYAVLKQMHEGDVDVKTFLPPQEIDGQTYAAATAWLNSQAALSKTPLDKEKQGQLIERFSAAVQTKSRERLDFARQEFGTIAGLYGQSKLQLLPVPYFQDWPQFFGYSRDTQFRHLFGMLATGMLLALGAPFWFNLLKSLTNLRSSLAQSIDKEENKSEAKPSGGPKNS
jgi:hypothetical protein